MYTAVRSGFFQEGSDRTGIISLLTPRRCFFQSKWTILRYNGFELKAPLLQSLLPWEPINIVCIPAARIRPRFKLALIPWAHENLLLSDFILGERCGWNLLASSN